MKFCSLACFCLPAVLLAQSTIPPVPPAVPAPAGVPGSEPAPALDQLSPLGVRPDWSELEAYAGSMTREEFEKAWSGLYAEQNALPPPFEITAEGLVVRTGQEAKPVLKIAFRQANESAAPSGPAKWRRAQELSPLKGRPVISDLHIAIDPAHIGGAWAAMEERQLVVGPDMIREGELSLLTARVLQDRLKALGAVVSLVRESHDPVTLKRPADFVNDARKLLAESGFPNAKATYEGLNGDAKLLTVQWQSEKLFYRVSEIHARGQRVNEQIRPDLVLCLHFNAEPWGDPSVPQFSPKNHLHLLVNGCYSNAELLQQDVRFEMLARLFGRVHEEEIPLAEAVAEGMAQSTGLPAYIYTTPNARRAGSNPYVYARNLLANRLYRCPVIYLEPYVMNHEETFRRLAAGHYLGRTLIGGKLVSSAIEDYVRGIVAGLTRYYQTQRSGS